MFNVWPSPLLPLTVAVTTTNWSLATKFRMHRSFCLDSWPGWACISNFRAVMRGRRKARHSFKERVSAMMGGFGAVNGS